MTLIIPPDHIDTPNAPAVILSFVTDHVRDLHTIEAVARVEDRLHDRLRILREREQPCDPIRDALALCAERRAELSGEAAQARVALSTHFPEGN